MYTPQQIQHIEQRSISIHTHAPQMLPVSVDRSVFKKTAAERSEVKQTQSNFKRNGLFEWNQNNRPGNNKKAA